MEQYAPMVDSRLGDPLLGPRAVGPACRDEIQALDLDQLYREHRVRLTRLATAITLDASLAEEVVQDAFAGLHRRFHDVENPVGYLQRSVVNASIKVLRRRRNAAMHRPERPPVTHIPEIDETWEAVTRLPARQRAVVALRYWEDLSEAEIADSLGWPTGTVKSTLHRALKRLKKEITS
jgi:RNA polymerase sigma-70 factor (sigma-E family)